MKICCIASEVDPFAKTGGLADVAAALPKALAGLGHDVRVIMPLYRQVDRAKFGVTPTQLQLSIPIGPQTCEGRVWQARLPKTQVPVYFIEQSALFDRDGLYQVQGKDHPDNLARFSFFSQAALRLLRLLEWQPDVVHCHDWQASLVCAHLAWGALGRESWFASMASVLTIHNLAYQGLFPREQWALTGLPESAFSMDGLEYYGQINCLKGGLVSADTLTTVSPTYAKEIQTPDVGCGLEGVLAVRTPDLVGILNGIDPDEWNPETDPHIEARYSAAKVSGKSLCKLALQKRQQLPEHHGLLIGMIQRLAEQKGIDIFVAAMEQLMTLPIQFVILGTGDPTYHEQLKQLSATFPGRIGLNLTFDNALAHQIEAGADAFLMPSRFEPCGLNQMYSMRFGTVPIVRRVGGLADTVVDVSPQTMPNGTATGFIFEPYTAQALVGAVQRAAAAFGDHTLWSTVMRHGMALDVSWNRSAREYVKVYERALAKQSKAAVGSRL